MIISARWVILYTVVTATGLLNLGLALFQFGITEGLNSCY